MAKSNTPTITEDKVHYFREQLFTELSNMFEWTGLPESIPIDYMERQLIRTGSVMFYEDSKLGYDVLRCEVVGYNRHDMPTSARTYVTSDDGKQYNQNRSIKRLSDSKVAVEQFDPKKDCVLIQNMDFGQDMSSIVEHFAQRMALAQQSFDTALLWTNVPYIFTTDNEDTRLSIEKMFSHIFDGNPLIIADKTLFTDNKDRAGIPTGIPYLGKELLDTLNELMMKFRERVGFETAGVDKAERLVTAEVKSNNQHTRTCLEIMLRQRLLACQNITAFYPDLAVSVAITGTEEQAEQAEQAAAEQALLQEGENNGTDNDRTASLAADD